MDQFGSAEGLPNAIGLGGEGAGAARLHSGGRILPRNVLPFWGRGSRGFDTFFWDASCASCMGLSSSNRRRGGIDAGWNKNGTGGNMLAGCFWLQHPDAMSDSTGRHLNQSSRWSDQDVEELRALAAGGGTCQDAERRFGRSRDAIRQKIGVLGISLARSPRPTI